jgi:hypothetical protein
MDTAVATDMAGVDTAVPMVGATDTAGVDMPAVAVSDMLVTVDMAVAAAVEAMPVVAVAEPVVVAMHAAAVAGSWLPSFVLLPLHPSRIGEAGMK